MRVQQMVNSRGNMVNNQFVIDNGAVLTFQSYRSQIADVDYNNKVVTIYEDYDYSNTTNKYHNLFFEKYANLSGLANISELRKALKSGSHGAWKVVMAS